MEHSRFLVEGCGSCCGQSNTVLFIGHALVVDLEKLLLFSKELIEG